VLRTVALALALAAGAASLISYDTLLVPAWRLRVVDTAGEPLTGVRVVQHAQHYSLESGGRRLEARSDRHGLVSFPERRVRASLLSRIVGPLRALGAGGVHASVGKSVSVMASTPEGLMGWMFFASSARARNYDRLVMQPLPALADSALAPGAVLRQRFD